MTGPGDAARSVERLTERATAHMVVYRLLGEPSSLDHAVETVRAAVGATVPGHPARPVALANLAGSLVTRFEIDGRAEDLADAAHAGQHAVEGMAPGDPARPGALTNLGAVLLARYERGGAAADLDLAVAAAGEAVDSGASPDPGASSSMLAMTLRSRSASSTATRPSGCPRPSARWSWSPRACARSGRCACSEDLGALPAQPGAHDARPARGALRGSAAAATPARRSARTEVDPLR